MYRADRAEKDDAESADVEESTDVWLAETLFKDLTGDSVEGSVANNNSLFSKSSLVQAQQADPELKSLSQKACSEADMVPECFYVKDDILMRKWRPPRRPADEDWCIIHQVVVSPCYLTEILKMAHELPMAGHVGSIRLVNGPSNTTGRVEVYYNGEWGTVCDDDWDDTDATVVCQILGLGVLGRARTAAAFGEGRGSIILDEVQCDGTETDIFDCSSNGVKNHNCGHNEDAGVECTNRGQTTATPTRSIRLVNGPSNTTGRVEVYYNGEWGTVCDDDWDDTDATVVCQILGLGVLGRARTAAAFGEGRGSIILDEVQCDGTETYIFDCSSNGVKNHNCGHNEDAGVECTNRGQTTATPTSEFVNMLL
nr:deleted in malignant brain tumors 1 protein-like [Lytechinus pictus]